MKAIFCETTSDISLILSEEEALGLKRTESHAPTLNAEDKEISFYLMNVVSENYINVKDVRSALEPHYFISINGDAYRDLIQNRRCTCRYVEASKVNIVIDD